MASNPEFVQYVADQCKDAGDITYKKMFGEYGIYCNGKIFGLICDNQLFVKITQAGRSFWPDLEEEEPYNGAKPYFLIAGLDDRERLGELVARTAAELPEPKPRKPRVRNMQEK